MHYSHLWRGRPETQLNNPALPYYSTRVVAVAISAIPVCVETGFVMSWLSRLVAVCGWATLTRAAVVPLVTGCGRSGTHAAAAALNELGLKAVHEQYQEDAIVVSWLYGADLPPTALIIPDRESGSYPFESAVSRANRLRTLERFSPVVQLVRHPLEVISSTRRCFCAAGNRTTPRQVAADANSWRVVEHFLDINHILPRRTSVEACA